VREMGGGGGRSSGVVVARTGGREKIGSLNFCAPPMVSRLGKTSRVRETLLRELGSRQNRNLLVREGKVMLENLFKLRVYGKLGQR